MQRRWHPEGVAKLQFLTVRCDQRECASVCFDQINNQTHHFGHDALDVVCTVQQLRQEIELSFAFERPRNRFVLDTIAGIRNDPDKCCAVHSTRLKQSIGRLPCFAVTCLGHRHKLSVPLSIPGALNALAACDIACYYARRYSSIAVRIVRMTS